MNSILSCVVNGRHDLWFNYEARQFIDQPCIFLKVCKSGLYQVALASNPKQLMSFASYNVTFDPPQTRMNLIKFSLDRLRASEVRSQSNLS